MNNKKFDINKHIYYGFQTYEEYFENYGITDFSACDSCRLEYVSREVEKDIMLNAQKYIDKILNGGFRFVFDDIQKALDIDSRNTIQTKIIPDLKTLYITKPCRDLIYAAVYGLDKYFEQFKSWTGAQLAYEKIGDKYSREELMEIYELKDLTEFGITREKFRKKLWFTYDDIANRIDDMFIKETKTSDGNIELEKLSKEEIEYILKYGLKSEKSIRSRYNLTNLTQLQRRIEKTIGDPERINVLFKVLMRNDKGFKNALTRYANPCGDEIRDDDIPF